jgi:hypothetical protein
LLFARVAAEELGTLQCLRCGAPLELDQPDIDEPGRLIASCSESCEECGTLHLVEVSEAAGESVLLIMPTRAELRQLLDTC